MNILKKRLKEYAITIYESGSPNTTPRSFYFLLKLYQKELANQNITLINDENGNKHTIFFLLNVFSLRIDNVELFIEKIKLTYWCYFFSIFDIYRLRDSPF